ncbi:MAG: molybdopterin-dependent oxidoreductase [Gemmatimonadota bacterium]|nr:molybdopterin-dependent oxidoreductase [Gemmatimonadota bacterium]
MSESRPPFLVRRTRLILRDLVDRAVEERAAPVAALDRRDFLRALARTTGTTLAAAYGASLLAACGSHGPDAARGLLRTAARRNEVVERWLFRHTSMDHARAGAVNAGESFPSYFVAPSVPIWHASTMGPWALEITGSVARPQRLTLAALQRLPRITQRVDHFCVEGWNAVAEWTGVRVSDLARLAGADPAARYVDFRSFDVEHPEAPADDAKRDPAVTPARLIAGPGYHECWDVESAMHPQTLVAYGMDGHLLVPAHGAPARLHSPVKLGYKNTKYLTQIVFLTDRTGGYWSDQGYEWYGGT